MNKRRSLLLVVTAAFFVSVLIYSVNKFFLEADEFYADHISKKVTQMGVYFKLSKAMLEVGKEEELKDLLSSATETYFFDYYVLYHQGEVISLGGIKPKSIYTQLPPERDELVIIPKDRVYLASDIGDYTILMGVRSSRDYYLSNRFRLQKNDFAKDALVIFFAFLSIIGFFLRDIIKIVEVLRTRGDKSLEGIRVRSREGQALIEGIRGYQKNEKSLKEQNLLLSHQLLPALRSELLSGKEPPYVFLCTLVRTDINGFSEIFSQYPIELFMEWIDRFFVEVTDLVSRYKGYIAEFVGDEVIFYFKDEDHENSMMIAIHVLEEINKKADMIHAQTMKKHEFPFRVKSSVAHGRLRFGKQVDGFNLAGSLFIETVRVLSQVTEKEENTIYFTERSASMVKDSVEFSSLGKVKLKGFYEPMELHKVERVKGLEEVADQLVYGDSSGLNYFRSPKALIFLFKKMVDHEIYKNTEAMLSAAKIWRDFPYVSSSKELGSAYFELLRAAKKEGSQEEGEKLKVLSSLISLASVFLDRRHITSEQGQELASFIAINHPRLSANAVEVLGQLKVPFSKKEAKTLLAFPHNRVVANALVRMGKVQVNRQVIEGLKDLLGHKEPVYRASGLYALGEIYSHYQKEDPIYLRGQKDLRDLMQGVLKYIAGDNEMVVRQAYLGILKSGDAGLKTVVRERLVAEKHPLLNQVAGILTPKWKEAG